MAPPCPERLPHLLWALLHCRPRAPSGIQWGGLPRTSVLLRSPAAAAVSSTSSFCPLQTCWALQNLPAQGRRRRAAAAPLLPLHCCCLLLFSLSPASCNPKPLLCRGRCASWALVRVSPLARSGHCPLVPTHPGLREPHQSLGLVSSWVLTRAPYAGILGLGLTS